MPNLVVDTVKDLELPSGAKITPSGLRLPPDLPFAEYEAVGKHLLWLKAKVEEAHDTILWYIGDWLNYGHFTYGEKFAQASELWGKSESRLRNVQWVARSIPSTRRRAGLSFRHHEEVAALPPKQQSKLLARAEREKLTADDLRRAKHELTDRDVAKYHWGEAETALNRAADLVAALPTNRWAEAIMKILVKPLRHEADRAAYRVFVRELYDEMGRWRDAN